MLVGRLSQSALRLFRRLPVALLVSAVPLVLPGPLLLQDNSPHNFRSVLRGLVLALTCQALKSATIVRVVAMLLRHSEPRQHNMVAQSKQSRPTSPPPTRN